MSGLVDLIFKPQSAQAQGPSQEETDAQKKQEKIIDLQEQRETGDRAARNKIITARARGAQTLFTRPGSIPKARALGGGGGQ